MAARYYSKTWCGFQIRSGEAAAYANIRLFGRYERHDLTFGQMKKEFMKQNDLVELDSDDLKKWMNSLGWRTNWLEST